MKMKKGLLSLLAVALTIVSCQDYDDQFAELTGLVNTLSTKVAGIETTTANLAAISATVNGLQTAIAAIPTTDSTADLTAVLEGLEAAQEDIEAIEELLSGGIADDDDLAAIDALIDTLQDGVNILLTNNQSISVSINIIDSATLATAQGLIELGENTPAGYLLGGNLLVDHDGLTGAEIIAANLLTAKLISVTGTVSITGAVDLSGLSYISGNYTKNGSIAPLDASITSLGAGLELDGGIGVINFPTLTSVLGNVTISRTGSVSSLDFSTISTIGAASTINDGNLTVASATTVNLGSFKMISVTANDATSINLGQTTAVALTVTAPNALTVYGNALLAPTGILTVNAPKATDVEFKALTSHAAVGPVISGSNSMTVVRFDKMTIAGGLSVPTEVKEFHMGSLVTAAADMTIKAKTIDITKLKTVSADVALASGNIANTALAAIGAGHSLTITAGSNGVQNFVKPALVVNVTGALSTVATDVSIKSTGDATLVNVLTAGNTSLTLAAQNVAVTGLADGLSDTALLRLNITGVNSTAAPLVYPSFTMDPTKFAVLKYLTVADLENFVLTAASAVGTITTAGKITDITIDTQATLYTVNIGHGPHTYTDAPAQKVLVDNNAELLAIDLTTVTKLDEADINTNAKLATIIAPAVGGGLLANAAVNINIHNANSLQATMTDEVLGTALIEITGAPGNNTFTSWKAFINQYAAFTAPATQGHLAVAAVAATAVSGEIAFTLDFQGGAFNTAAAPATFTAHTGFTAPAAAIGGAGDHIDTLVELAYINSND
jgi:hypothetical protein